MMKQIYVSSLDYITKTETVGMVIDDDPQACSLANLTIRSK